MNVPRNCVPNSMLRLSKLFLWLIFLLSTFVFVSTIEAKSPAKAAPQQKQNKPSSLKPMSGAQMDTYVPAAPAHKYPSNSAPRMLQGSLEHAETLPAEDSRFAAGTMFDASALPEYKAGNNWFWVPSWFAGNYKTESLTRTYRYDYRTGATDLQRTTSVLRRTEKWGWQQDRSGGIWQYDSAPYRQEVDRDTLQEFQLCKERVPVKITNNSVTLRFRITSIFINRKTEKVEWTIQSEFLQTYVPVGPNRLKVDISAKSFDVNGKPTTIDKNVQYLDRIAGFEPLDVYNGKDMRIMFRDFLIAHNRADLIPGSGSGF